MVAPAAAKPALGGVVYVVGIGDSNEPNLGNKLRDDAENFVRMMSDAFAKAGQAGRLRTRVLLGDEVSPRNILAKVEALPIGGDDRLIVLISCHGAMDYDHRHDFTLAQGRLARADLLAAMRKKNPKLAVLMSDCCSSYPDRSTPTPRYEAEFGAPMAALPVAEWKTIESLFLLHEGLIDITSSEPGYPSSVATDRDGSLYTNAVINVLKASYADLVRSLDRDHDGWLQWDEVLPQVRRVAADFHRTQGSNGRAQQARATSLGRWVPSVMHP